MSLKNLPTSKSFGDLACDMAVANSYELVKIEGHCTVMYLMSPVGHVEFVNCAITVFALFPS